MKLPPFDPYKELGVSPDATSDEIRSAQRRLVRQWHPDRNPQADASTRFNRIQEAYALLADPDRRRLYDDHRRQVREAEANRQRQKQQEREARARATSEQRDGRAPKTGTAAQPAPAKTPPRPRPDSRPAASSRKPTDDDNVYELRDTPESESTRARPDADSLLDAAVGDMHGDSRHVADDSIVDSSQTPVRERAQGIAFNLSLVVAGLTGLVCGGSALVMGIADAADAAGPSFLLAIEFYPRVLLAAVLALLWAVLAAVIAFVPTFSVTYLLAGAATAIVVLARGRRGSTAASPRQDREAGRVARLLSSYGACLLGCIVALGTAAWLAFSVAPGLSRTSKEQVFVLSGAVAVAAILFAAASGMRLLFRLLDGSESLASSASGNADTSDTHPPTNAGSQGQTRRHPGSFGESVRSGEADGTTGASSRRERRGSVECRQPSPA